MALVESGSSEAAASRLTARGAKTRSRIIATAADLMRVRGVGGTTLDDVVVASNVSKSQLYRHFEDKQALVRAVIEFVGDRRIAEERERLSKVMTFAGLRRWRDAVVENNALHEGRYGCALGSIANEVADQDSIAREKLHELFAAWEELFDDLLRRFQKAGLIPPEADVSQLATGLLAAVQGGYLLAQTARDVTPMASAIDMTIAHLQMLNSSGAHGQTLMIVLPLTRSVGLKAATASSRVATCADVRPQPSVTHPLDDLTQLGAVGHDDEVDRQAVGRPGLGRPGDGHQRSAGSNQARGPLLDVAADDVEDQIDAADVFQGVVVEVDELVRAEVERRLPVGGAAGADDVGAGLSGELGRHRTDGAGRAVHEDALAGLEAAVIEQPLPRGQARHRDARAHREVDVARQRREVACLDDHVLREGAVTGPVREAEHPLSHRQAGCAIAEGGDHSGQLVAGDRRRPVAAEAIDPGRGPLQLVPGESRRMNLNDDIAVARALDWRASPRPDPAAPPASSRPFRRPGPSPRSLSCASLSVSSLRMHGSFLVVTAS